ncbi:transposase [Kitasatospora griseola]|uniref:transposase n=1 Tax=Kitasatospora griseola TaxID=2064 RepID=UPI00364C9009
MIDRTAPGPFLSDHLIVGSGASVTDAQWARTEPLLPDRTPRRGGRWRDHREVIDAIAFKCRTGTPWMDLPERFGSWRAAHNRLRMWGARRHVGESVHRPARPGRRRGRPGPGGGGRLDDRARPPTRRRGPAEGAPDGEPRDHALGRSAAGRSRRSTSPPTGAAGRSPSTSRPARPATCPHSRRSWLPRGAAGGGSEVAAPARAPAAQ